VKEPARERAGGALTTRQPRQKQNQHAAQLVALFPELRNIARIVEVRRCLEPETWKAIQWRAATETGGWYP
jgi:hypothetical protein